MRRITQTAVYAVLIAALLILTSVSAFAEQETYGVVTGSCVNIREMAGTEHSIVGQLYRGTTIKVLAIEGDWIQMCYNGDVYGWMHGAYISVGQEGTDMNSNIVEFSKNFLGVPYAYGGTSPKGFDCSGFTQYVFKQFGIGLNRVAASQASQGQWVARGNLLPGDLVFFDTMGKIDGGISHAGIYIGNNQFIHSSSPGSDVKISDMGAGYYNPRFVVARRVIN